MGFAPGTRVGRLVRLLDLSAKGLLVAGGLLLTVTIIVQVALRYVFKAPLFGLEELSRTIALWLYFSGAAYGSAVDGQIKADILERLGPPPAVRRIVHRVSWILSSVACGLLTFYSWRYALWVYESGELTTGLWWPRVISVSSAAFGGAAMLLLAVFQVVRPHVEAAAPQDFEGL